MPGSVWMTRGRAGLGSIFFLRLLTWTRRSNGYDCTLDLRSTSDKEVNYRVILPERLPRGAITQPGEGFSPRITLPAGHSIQIRYTEVYQR